MLKFYSLISELLPTQPVNNVVSDFQGDIINSISETKKEKDYSILITQICTTSNGPR